MHLIGKLVYYIVVRAWVTVEDGFIRVLSSCADMLT